MAKKKPETLPSVISTFEQYLQYVGRIALLTPKEERELAVRSWEDKDREAAQQLVLANLRFVIKIANEYRNYGLRVMDLVQEGNMGLMRAIKTFNPYKEVRLITYAVWWIRSFMHEYIQRNWSLVKIGTTQAQRKLFYKLKKEEAELLKMGLDPSIKLLSTRLGVKESDVEQMQQRLSGRDMSLNTPMSGEDEGAAHIERVTEPTEASDELLSAKESRDKFLEALSEFKPGLSEKDLYILENRLLSEDPMTLESIGNHFGITKERVRQLEVKIKKNLKKFLEEKDPSFKIQD